LLWWQKLHSQGTQDVFVWQGGSWWHHSPLIAMRL
jgi:hypothetical protein